MKYDAAFQEEISAGVPATIKKRIKNAFATARC